MVCVSVQSKLRHNQQLRLKIEQASIHLSFFVAENSKRDYLSGEFMGVFVGIMPPNTQKYT